MGDLWSIVMGLLASAVALWLVLVVSLLLARPGAGAMGEILRLLPDTARLLRKLALDPAVPRGARVRLWLAFAYLAMPFDLIPDFIPMVGHLDDVIVVYLALRSVLRRAGGQAIGRNWPGTEQGLAALWRAAGLPLRDHLGSESPGV